MVAAGRGSDCGDCSDKDDTERFCACKQSKFKKDTGCRLYENECSFIFNNCNAVMKYVPAENREACDGLPVYDASSNRKVKG